MTTPNNTVAGLPAILRDRAKASEVRGYHHAQWSEGVRFAANQIEVALGAGEASATAGVDEGKPMTPYMAKLWLDEQLADHDATLPAEVYDALIAALQHPAAPSVSPAVEGGTPPSRWSANGEPDPHGTQYDCERAALAMGDLTDDELANAVFLHGDERPSIADMASGKALPAIAYFTAAKDRIRWLSRRLATAEQPGSAVQGEAVAWQVRPRHFPEYGWREVPRFEADRFDQLYPVENWERRQVFTTPPPAPAADHIVDANKKVEARGVEGMVLVPRSQLVELQSEYLVEGGMGHDLVTAMLAATPNPVRAEQPEGKGAMKLVPVEPTAAMKDAMAKACGGCTFGYHDRETDTYETDREMAQTIYAAMLAAAPSGVRVDEMEDLLRSAHEIALRQGADTNWDGLAKSIAKIGIGPITARHYFADGTPRETINKHLDALLAHVNAALAGKEGA